MSRELAKDLETLAKRYETSLRDTEATAADLLFAMLGALNANPQRLSVMLRIWEGYRTGRLVDGAAERERDALRAALDAVAAALRPALEAAETYLDVSTYPAWDGGDCRLCGGLSDSHTAECVYARSEVALRNALPAVRAALDKVKP